MPFFDDLFNSTKMRSKYDLRNHTNVCNMFWYGISMPLKPLLLLLLYFVTGSLPHNHVVLPCALCFVEVVFYI